MLGTQKIMSQNNKTVKCKCKVKKLLKMDSKERDGRDKVA